MARTKTAPMPMMDRDYQAEDDHRTLTRAHEIASDHGRMAGVRKHHAKMTKSLKAMTPMMQRGLAKGGR